MSHVTHGIYLEKEIIVRPARLASHAVPSIHRKPNLFYFLSPRRTEPVVLSDRFTMPVASTIPYHAALKNPFDDPTEYPEEPISHTDYPPPPSIPNSSNPVIHVRTPSPTPSEAKELQHGAINWKAMRSWKFWFRKEWRCKQYAPSLTLINA